MFNAKNILFFLAISILFVTATHALEVKKTEFVITTEPYQNLSISVVNPDTNEEIQVFAGRARKFGEYRFTYYSTIQKVLLSASIMNNQTGEVVKNKKLGPYTLGAPQIALNFSLADEQVVEEEPQEEEVEVNETLPETSKSSEEGSERSAILGFVIGENGEFRKIYYYIGAGALIAIILIILLKKGVNLKSSPTEPDPNKVIKSKSDKPTKEEVKAQKQEIAKATAPASVEDTENKITDLQKQLEQIRNEEKLLQLQKQLNSERNRLDKLRKDLNN